MAPTELSLKNDMAVPLVRSRSGYEMHEGVSEYATILKETLRRSPTARPSQQRELLLPAGGPQLPPTTPTSNVCSAVNGGIDPSLSKGDQQEASAGFGTCAVIALLACFMGATDGLSLGAVIFPSNAEHPNTDFKNLGMSLGLLSALISNLMTLCFSDIRFCVGGAIIPMVAVMTTVFTRIGPSEPQTILAAVGLVSFISGILFYISGMNFGVKQIVNTCPIVVFGGFLAGTGATLFDFGFQLLVPGFTSLLDFSSHGAPLLFTAEGSRLVAAPIIFGVCIFLIDRWGLIKNQFLAKLTTPITLILVTILFYIVLGVSGTSLEEARAQGWMFPVEIPKNIDCYKVWTMRDFSQIKWNLIFTSDFAIGVMRSYFIGLLTLTKNVYGVKESFGLHDVDIDKEIRIQGGTCILGGALGALPANVVMSFTCTAKKGGVPVGKSSFGAWLLFWSTLFFVFGEYIIAVCPKMIPGIVLIWLAIAFCSYWLYDLVGKVPASEHLVVVAMTLVDMVLDAGSMILMGLFCTLVILGYRLTRMEACSKVASLGVGVDAGGLCKEVTFARSDIQRSTVMKNCLTKHGRKALILCPRDLTFLTCSQLLEEIVERIETRSDDEEKGESHCLEVLALVVEGMGVFGIHFINMISELDGLSKKHGFRFVLGGVEDEPMRAIRRYYNQPEVVDATTTDDVGPTVILNAKECHDSEVLNKLCSGIMLIPTEVCGKRTGAYAVVVEVCENLLLYKYGGNDMEIAAKTITGEDIRNSDTEKLSLAADLAGISKEHPARSVAMSIHRWLNGYDKGYTVNVLSSIAALIEVKTFEKGDVIYSPENVTLQEMAISRGPSEKIPPLVWLLRGELIHKWMGGNYDFSHFRGYERQYDITKEGFKGADSVAPRFQGGIVTKQEQDLGMVVGPFSTLLGFQGAMPHVGKLTAKGTSTVALLRRESYDKLDAVCAKCLDIYLARNTFVNGSDPSMRLHM